MRSVFRFLAVAALAAVPASLRAQDADFKVIVNSATAVGDLPAADLSKIFLKQGGFPGGAKAVPVEPAKGAAARAAFAKKVHGRPVAAIETYWQNQVFSGGESPPPTKGSDAEIVAFVKATPGAIGYVSAGAGTAGVKVIAVK